MDRYSAPIVAATLLFTLLLQSGCTPKTVDPDDHRTQVEDWQNRRLARLKANDGWLTLIGLAWLSQGENSCGSDPENQIVLPSDRAPAHLGTFVLNKGTVQFTVAKGVSVYHDSIPVSTLQLRDDHHDNGPTTLTHGSLLLYVIKRGDEFGVRIKDSLSANRLNFGALSFFPISLAWRVEATYRPFEQPKIIDIPAMAGPPQTFTFPGSLTFVLGGKEFSLDAAYEEGLDDNLFLMFGDETNGVETYGAGRQLYTDLPDADSKVVIDFNRAYNWPCVYTEFATCPLPPVSNILKIRVEAGEQVPAHH